MGHLPPEEQALTTREIQALKFYRDHVDEYKTAPTMRALGAHLGIAHSAAHYIVKRLALKGYLQEKPVTEMRLKLSRKGRKVAL